MPKAIRLAVVLFILAVLRLPGSYLFVMAAAPLAATAPVVWLRPGNFAVLAGAAVNDTNVSAITGDVGLSPATLASCPSIDVRRSDWDNLLSRCFWSYALHDHNAGLLTTAKNDLTMAYNDAAGRPGATTIAKELGGQTLPDGIYDSASTTFEIVAGGTLILDGGGLPIPSSSSRWEPH